MPKRSAGILMYRRRGRRGSKLLLVHPGGPFWARKDVGAWSIPKGEYAEGEDALAVAMREFEEETGVRPRGEFCRSVSSFSRAARSSRPGRSRAISTSGALKSNLFEMEWPPRSGRKQSFPEVDRARMVLARRRARKKILAGQSAFIDRLLSGARRYA